jgi:hypothetical protein
MFKPPITELRQSNINRDHSAITFTSASVLYATPDNAVAPTERQLQDEDTSIAVQNVHRLAAECGIRFG